MYGKRISSVENTKQIVLLQSCLVAFNLDTSLYTLVLRQQVQGYSPHQREVLRLRVAVLTRQSSSMLPSIV